HDVCLESYWQNEAEQSLNTGFTAHDSRDTFVFNIKNLRESGPRLMKLHGSIDWFELDDGAIEKYPPGTKEPYGGSRIRGEVFIAPVREKHMYRYPWFEMYYLFSEALAESSCWIVIGYSFRDEGIRGIFANNATNDKKIILVHPHSEEIESELMSDFNSNIKCVAKRFGKKKHGGLD
ncbi:MAG: SIR2 family protein, partial [Thermoplasmata archaeon]|nr:SIR2 family protein [Thermoplasmata archaeon]